MSAKHAYAYFIKSKRYFISKGNILEGTQLTMECDTGGIYVSWVEKKLKKL